MTTDHLKAILESYRDYLRLAGYTPARKPDTVDFPDLTDQDSSMALSHCLWMCYEALKFIEDHEAEKAMRWLCFIQGCFWFTRLFTIETMREHSRPPERGGKLLHFGLAT